MSLLWSCSVWESWQQFAADLRGTILAILNSCQSFGTVPMQRLASEIGKLRQFAQLFAAIPTLLVAIRHHATLPGAICSNRQNASNIAIICNNCLEICSALINIVIVIHVGEEWDGIEEEEGWSSDIYNMQLWGPLKSWRPYAWVLGPNVSKMLALP